jgi:hypothetical protein
MTETRECGNCKDTPGEYVQKAFSYEGRNYPERRRPCSTCKGIVHMPSPDAAAIVDAIRGRNPRKLRSKRPDDRRAYFVWRMARFHGGADVTMPMTAMMEVGRDPWLKELESLADHVAKLVFGTDLAAAHRWGRAFGTIDRDLPGLPDSAYSGGRVADQDKPESEFAELT